jgi:hypothetical protein
MRATQLCDRCWELERRMERDPKLAARMMKKYAPLVSWTNVLTLVIYGVVCSGMGWLFCRFW